MGSWEALHNPLHSAPGQMAQWEALNPLRSGPSATSNDAAIAAALAGEETEQQELADRAHAAAARAALDRELALNVHEVEVQELCRQMSAHLSVVPQLLEAQPLERQRSTDMLRRLSDAQGVALQPHVNPCPFPPQPPPPTVRQRLEARLDMYGLCERLVKGDGNCQFRSLSDQLYRSPRLHAFVRECVVQQLRQHRARYEAYVPDDYEAYCRKMAKSGEWGDHVTLQAAADYFGLRINVLTSFEHSCFIEIEPRQPRSSRTLYLSFWAEVHYNSVYLVDEPPPPLPTEKILGSRRLFNLLFGETGTLVA